MAMIISMVTFAVCLWIPKKLARKNGILIGAILLLLGLPLGAMMMDEGVLFDIIPMILIGMILCRRNKSIPVFIGEHGVGKSAIVRGLAERIDKGNVPQRLKGKRVLQFDLSAAIAGTPFRGDWEKKIKEVMDGVTGPGDIILFIDDIHNLVGAGRFTETTIDSVSLLAPYIESGQLSVIGTSAFGEYRLACNRNRIFSSLFQTIDVADQDKEESAIASSNISIRALAEFFMSYCSIDLI